MLRIMILKEHGTNCEIESKYAFEKAASSLNAEVNVDIVHMEDLIRDKQKLSSYQVLMFPGGFSYGDDTGSANAWANRVKNHLLDEVLKFIQGGNLVLGVCNGFQLMVNLGLFPVESSYGICQQALVHNDSARYTCRWVDVKFLSGSPWLNDISTLMLPVAHGEGKFYAEQNILDGLINQKMVAGRYVSGEICSHLNLPANPNGSLDNIAAITDLSGRLLGMMPHPERAIYQTQFPNYTLLRELARQKGECLPSEGCGLQIFKNAIKYFIK